MCSLQILEETEILKIERLIEHDFRALVLKQPFTCQLGRLDITVVFYRELVEFKLRQ